MSDLYKCPGCGHRHFVSAAVQRFVSAAIGYVPCPVCDYKGQDDSPREGAAIRALFPNATALADVAEKVRAGGLTRFAR